MFIFQCLPTTSFLSLVALIFSEDDPGTTSGIEFFAITVNGLWLLAVVIKSSILDVDF